MNKYFTADWHLGDHRFDLMHRYYKEVERQDWHITINFLAKIKEKEPGIVYHLGDVVHTLNDYNIHRLKNLKKNTPHLRYVLIRGNYDEGKEDRLQELLFDEIHDELTIEIEGKPYYLNHYPTKCLDKPFAITGHIHSLWKVQPNMINVGVDAWHFEPVTKEHILFTRNAIENYYDQNVFPQTITS